MQSADPVWTKTEAKKVKQADVNNRAGAIFEILGLSIFQGGHQQVQPARKSNPGYDGVVSTAVGETYLSLKNWGISAHEAEVQKRGIVLEVAFVALLRQRNVTGVSLRIIAKEYPTTNSLWGELESGLAGAIAHSMTSGAPAAIGGFRSIVTVPIAASYGPFHDREISYQILLVVPYHANEADNVISKLDHACKNLRENASRIPESAVCRVLARLPVSASMETCVQWARGYFGDRKDPPLNGLFLYQPTVAMNSLRHCFSHVENPYADRVAVKPLQGVFFVGIVDPTPTKLVLTDGINQMPLDKFYTYQRGNIYTLYEQKGNLPLNADLNYLTSGVKRHGIMRINGQDMILQGNFPPTDQLLLLP